MLIYLQMLKNDADKSKFEELYLRYRGLMYNVAFGILNNRDDAEDSVHQAFIAIIDNFDKIRDVESPQTRSFCVICSKNKAIDLYRAKRRWGEAELYDNLLNLPAPQLENTLDTAIANLPVTLGSVVLLHYDNGYTIEEIAEILDISIAAARKRLTRAKELLK